MGYRVVLCMAAAITLNVVAGPGTPAAQQPVIIKLGNVHQVDLPIQVGLKKFADLVALRTKGQLQIQLFMASQLGTEQELLEGVQLGTVHMMEGATGAVGRFLPDLEAFSAPYIWRDVSHMVKTVRGPIGQGLAARLVKAKGLRILDMGWVWGTRHLTTKNKAVQRPEDLKGQKIRVQPVQIYLETIRAMGGNPVPLDAKEVYLGLQSGVIDGQENPSSNIFIGKMYEVQKYVMLTGHILQNNAVVLGDKFYQSLSPAYQKILTDSAVEAGDFQNELALKQETLDLEHLKEKGMTIVQPDVKAFREATKDVYKKFADKWEPRLVERILETK
jgi:TRAP-type transport system periplasmic protein